MSDPPWPSSAPTSRPSSPTKHRRPIGYQPNPHPYAIKTTATSILSRSATTNSATHSRNHYVPLSSSPSPTKSSFSHSERGSRHRYSKSLTDDDAPRPLPPPPEQSIQASQRSRGWSDSHSTYEPVNPKHWTPSQLAAHLPDLASFIEEQEITGRAFLRFDEGVLDAYGVTDQKRRSTILSASHGLRQLANKGHSQADPFKMHDSIPGSASAGSSPVKSRIPLPTSRRHKETDDDLAYISSSSASSSSLASEGAPLSRRRTRPKSNSRVHGIITSLERSSSIDRRTSASRTHNPSQEGQSPEELSSGGAEVDADEYLIQYPTVTNRPLPSPPSGPYFIRPTKTGESIPTSSFPFASNTHTFVPTARAEYDITELPSETPMIRTEVRRPQMGSNGSRPLPAPPPPVSLREPPSFEFEDEDEGGPQDTSGEMTVEELLATLGPDDNIAQEASTLLENVSIHKAKTKGKSKAISSSYSPTLPSPSNRNQGAAAWESLDIRETVKRVPLTPPIIGTSIALTQPRSVLADIPMEEEPGVEELLAIEGKVSDTATDGRVVGAWLEPLGQLAVQATVRRAASDGDGVPERLRMGSGKERMRVKTREEERMDQIDLGKLFPEEGISGGVHVTAVEDTAVGSYAAVPPVQLGSIKDDEDILLLEAQMEETRRVVEALRRRVIRVETSIEQMEGEFEMQMLSIQNGREKKENGGQSGRVEMAVQVEAESSPPPSAPFLVETVPQTSPYAHPQLYHTWIRSLFNVLFSFPLGLYSVFKPASSSASSDVPLYRGLPRFAFSLCVDITRYAVSVPRHVVSVGFAMPRYVLLLGIGVCAFVLRSVGGKEGGLLRKMLLGDAATTGKAR